MSRAKGLKLLLGLSVSVFFIWLILRDLDVSAVGAALSASDPAWILAAVVSFALGYVCRIERWRTMLGADGARIGFAQCAVPFLTSIAANNLLPFRAGDALRAVAFTHWLGRPTATVLATMIVERVLDLLTLLLMLGIALKVFGAQISGVEAVFGLGAVALWSIAALGLAVLMLPSLFERGVQNLLARGLKQDTVLMRAVSTLFSTLKNTVQGGRIIPLSLWSLLAWCFEGGVFYAVARAIPPITEPIYTLLALPIATLSTLLPSTPGYAGTFHYFTIQTLELFDTPLAVAAAYAFVIHLVLWLTATLAGGVCAVIWMISDRQSVMSGLKVNHP